MFLSHLWLVRSFIVRIVDNEYLISACQIVSNLFKNYLRSSSRLILFCNNESAKFEYKYLIFICLNYFCGISLEICLRSTGDDILKLFQCNILVC